MCSTRSLRSNRRLGRLTAIDSVKAERHLPLPGLACRFAQRPFGQGHDQAGVLGQRNEIRGWHQGLATPPAHQGLGAHHAG
jgi:hypothetical protein